MILSSEEQEWVDFLQTRWTRYVREQKLSPKAEREQLSAFMAGGSAILDAVLKWQQKPPPKI